MYISEVQCAPPNDIRHGEYINMSISGNEERTQIVPDKLLYGTHLNVRCDDGYILSNNNTIQRMCREDGTWSNVDPICIESRRNKQETSSVVNKSAVIGSSIGAAVAVIIILLSIFLFILMRRKRQKSKAPTSGRWSPHIQRGELRLHSNANNSFRRTPHSNTCENMEYSSIDEIHMSPETGEELEENNSCLRQPEKALDVLSTKQEDDYYNIIQIDKKSSTAIMLEDLNEFVSSGKPSAKILETQILNLPTGLLREHETARKSENAKKNRYKQIYAYDYNRVILNDGVHQTNNDYINASYIHGFDSARAYVATQGEIFLFPLSLYFEIDMFSL